MTLHKGSGGIYRTYTVYRYNYYARNVIGSSTTTHEEGTPRVKPKKGQEVVCHVCQCVTCMHARVHASVRVCTEGEVLHWA